jgi:hypothetical protein
MNPRDRLRGFSGGGLNLLMTPLRHSFFFMSHALANSQFFAETARC